MAETPSTTVPIADVAYVVRNALVPANHFLEALIAGGVPGTTARLEAIRESIDRVMAYVDGLVKQAQTESMGAMKYDLLSDNLIALRIQNLDQADRNGSITSSETAEFAALLELQQHRAVMARLSTWIKELREPDNNGRYGVGPFIAQELEDRIAGKAAP